MNLYLAGPMRGIPGFNFPKFDEVTATLRFIGHTVFSPAEHDRECGFAELENSPDGSDESTERAGFSLAEALIADLTYIAREADGVYLLPGWEKSKGCAAEVALATALGKPLFFHRELGE
ncbi:MAG: DUF4406 domain-containing protein [Pseudomonadota bacterium]|nr:DUF4406 domain-containing protein [Pseudomonadota bacterium]